MSQKKLLVIALPMMVGAAHAEEIDATFIENLPIQYLYTVMPPESSSPDTAQSSTYANDRRWEAGRVLRVCMFDGNKSVARLIKDVASEWNQYSGVKLNFGPSPSGFNCLDNGGFYEVKVHFGQQGFWSLVGKDSVNIAEPVAPSMNLQRFNLKYSERKVSPDGVMAAASAQDKAVILHEFGHALGLLHEHQNPNLNCQNEIKWNGPGNVYDYYGKPPNEWSEEEVKRNLGFIALSDPDFVAGPKDSHSIMMYSLPPQIMKNPNGPCVVPSPLKLSELDKQTVAKIYPAVSATELHKDVELASSNVRALPASLPVQNRAALLQRALADIESQDTFTRRDARLRLSDLLQQDSSRKSEIINVMPEASYRYQLGVSTALLKGKEEITLSKEDREVLRKVSKKATDSTLKTTLDGLTPR